jgi:hypothetical protein
LELSAGRAEARGGVAAAAAFMERSAELTVDPASRARRALVAAEDKRQAGALEAALALATIAEQRTNGRFATRTVGRASRADRFCIEPGE